MEIMGNVAIRIQVAGQSLYEVGFKAESESPREFSRRLFQAFDRAEQAAGDRLMELFPDDFAQAISPEDQAMVGSSHAPDPVGLPMASEEKPLEEKPLDAP
jgi:hypothetical protein